MKKVTPRSKSNMDAMKFLKEKTTLNAPTYEGEN